jgi:uncharacterized protein (DUF305 family)
LAPDKRFRATAALIACVVLVAAGGFAAGRWWPDRSGPAPRSVSMSAADIQFAQDMSTHHEQAVLLAQTLARDADPQILALADQIRLAQSGEIAMMHGWLTLIGAPFTPDTSTSMPVMTTMPGMAEMPSARSMPGMAGVAELTRLSRLTGRDAEILFLQLMIRHHRGGIDMAQAAYNGPLLEPVRRTALEMVQDQGNEIGLMTAMLTVRNAAPLPYP